MTASGAGPDSEVATSRVTQLQARLALHPGEKSRLECLLAGAVQALEIAVENAHREIQQLAHPEAERLTDRWSNC